jgi:DNA-directed RNA polymerase specialized sigma24 family protein
VRYWVYQRASTLQADRIDDLTQETFLAFWRFFTLDKLERATELSEVLAYLRSCAYTAVARFYRQDNKTPPTIPLQPFFGPPSSDRRTESKVLQRTHAEQVWTAIEGRCQDEQERVLAYATFIMEMKPRQICRQYPDLFPSREHVYRAKHTLITRLRRDPTIRALNDAVECKKREDRD